MLAHELGHFKLGHIARRIGALFAASLVVFAAFGWLATQLWFFAGLGVRPPLGAPDGALALLLLVLVAPVFGFFVAPSSPACRVATSSRPMPGPQRRPMAAPSPRRCSSCTKTTPRR